MYPSALKLYKRFSLLVDEIDFKRRQLPADLRSKSDVLDKLYRRADAMIIQLKRLGGY